MATEFVGNGVLPNVYFSKIEVTDWSNTNDAGVANVYVRDYINERGKPSWCEDPVAKNKIGIMFFYSTSRSEIDLITNGAMSMKEIKSSNSNSLHVEIKGKQGLTYVKRGGDIYLTTQFKFKVPKNISNFTVFCCMTFVPSSKRYSNVHGPVASEHIVRDLKYSSRSFAFVKSDGTQWYGPVHYHDSKGYMEGSRHTSRPHGVLNKFNLPNLKLVNNTKLKYREKRFYKKKYVSEMGRLFHSFRSNKTLNGLFSINYRNILMNQTKYGHFLENISNKEFDKILNLLKIVKMRIVKIKINKHSHKAMKKFDLISSAGEGGVLKEAIRVTKHKKPIEMHMDDLESMGPQLQDINKIYLEDVDEYGIDSSLKESDFKDESGIKFYEFVDNEFNQNTFGLYKYEVNIVFKDPTIRYFREMVLMSRRALSGIKKMLGLISIKENYDYDLNKINDSLFDEPEYEDSLWKDAVKNYLRCYDLFYDTSEEREDVVNSVLTRANPKSGTLNSIKLFIQDYNNLMNHVHKSFDLTSLGISDTFSTHKVKQLRNEMRSNLISMSHEFRQVIDSIDNKRFYNYLTPNVDSGVMEISSIDFANRISIEEAKFANTEKQSNFSYLSPISVYGGNEKILMSNMVEIDVKRLNRFFDKFNLIKKVNLQIYSLPRGKSEEVFQVREDMLDSKHILGDSSKFVNNYKHFQDVCYERPEKIDFLVHKSTTPRSLGMISRVREGETAPPQIKQKKLYGDLRKVASESPDILLKVNFFLLQKIEVFRGFEMGNLNVPMWSVLGESDLTESPRKLLCRMNYYNNSSGGVEPELKLGYTNKYFFLTPSRVTSPIEEEDGFEIDFLGIDMAMEMDFDAATSNIVKWDSDLAFGLADDPGPPPTWPDKPKSILDRADSGGLSIADDPGPPPTWPDKPKNITGGRGGGGGSTGGMGGSGGGY